MNVTASRQCETVTTLPESSRRRGLCDQGALVVANADFVCYGIKSNIRVIHRPTGARALIKLPTGSGAGSVKAMPQVRRAREAGTGWVASGSGLCREGGAAMSASFGESPGTLVSAV